MKKKLIIATPLVLVVGYLFVLSILTFRAKNKYDAFTQEYRPPIIVEMAPAVEKKFYEEISKMRSDPFEGVNEQEEVRIAFETLGIPYNTQGFVDLVTFDPPAFDLFDMDSNRVNSEKMIFQAVVGSAINTDGILYVKKRKNKVVQVFSRSHQNCIIEIKDRKSEGFIQILYITYLNPTGSNQPH